MSDDTRAPPPGSLYVHVPFCRQRCHYCDFSLVRARRPPVDAWLRALERDLAEWFSAGAWEPGARLHTIYVGGGTPSLLGADGMRRLARVLEAWFEWTAVVEWTAEANPSSLSAAVCDSWLATGVNRLSIGVQSFDDRALEWLGRWHDAAAAMSAVRRAAEAGFDNISIDLMFGLPATIARDWSVEVDTTVGLGVQHVSVYGLTVEPRTALGRWVELGRRFPADDRSYASEYLEASERLSQARFVHYEVSNFARPGHESRHNWHYWDGSGYLGIGPSAHSYLPPLRVWNIYRWDAYRKAADAGQTLREGREVPTPEQDRLERLWLGLRTRGGLGGTDLEELSPGTRERLAAVWTEEKWMKQDRGRWRLTPAGWLLLDRLVIELASEHGRDSEQDG